MSQLRSTVIMSDLPPLNTDTIWAILNEELDDAIVNKLVWHYLGYRYNWADRTWNTEQVIDDWAQKISRTTRFLSLNRPPTVKLTRSIPKENKQLLKQKLGFKGYKLGEFGPRQTRRATAANWLLNYLER